jgi:hypothetical protein
MRNNPLLLVCLAIGCGALHGHISIKVVCLGLQARVDLYEVLFLVSQQTAAVKDYRGSR